MLLEPRRRDHDGVPAPAAADGGEPVRHHLSRALLLPLVRRRSSRSSRITGSRCSTSRNCRRTAARCASTRATPRTQPLPVGAARARRCAQREIDDGFLTHRALPRLRRAGEGDQAQAARLPDRSQASAARRIVGYGAPGKGNTLLNYCGIRTDFLDFTVDANPYKQGKFTPGTHIPILAPERDPRDAARLRADPAVEPQGRDLARSVVHRRVGRPLRRADSRGAGARESNSGRIPEPPEHLAMKILVTGTEGYIGARLAPWLHAQATRSPAWTPASTATAACTSIRIGMPFGAAHDLQGPAHRHAGRLREASMRSCIWPSCRTIRSGRTVPRSRSDQSRGLGAHRAGRARGRRAALRLHVVVQRLRRRHRRDSSTRRRRRIRRPPTRSARCWSSATCCRWPTAILRGVPAQRHRLRPLAAHALRHRAQRPVRAGLDARRRSRW